MRHPSALLLASALLWPLTARAAGVKVGVEASAGEAAVPGIGSMSMGLTAPMAAPMAAPMMTAPSAVAPLASAPIAVAAPVALAPAAAALAPRAALPVANLGAAPVAAPALRLAPANAATPAADAPVAAPTVRAQLDSGARAAAAMDAAEGSDGARLGRRAFDAAADGPSATSDDGASITPPAPPLGGSGGGGSNGDRRGYTAALRRLGVPAATIAALDAAATAHGRRLAPFAASVVVGRRGEFTGDQAAALIVAALLRGAPAAASAPALAELARTHPRAAAQAAAVERPASATLEGLAPAERAWSLAWAPRLEHLDATVSAGSDVARLRALSQSAHFAYLPAALRDAVDETLRFHDRPAVAAATVEAAPTRGPPAEETVEAVLDRAVARGDMDAAAAAEWTKVVYRDGLLGLRNRVDLDEHLPQLVATSKTLIVFKLDFLKEINDTLGHDAGNEALKKLAAIAARGFPKEALFRRSPTGFSIMSDAGPDEARRIAESDARLMAEALRAIVDEKMGDPSKAVGRRVSGVDWGGTISVGVAALEHTGGPEQVYAKALTDAESARIFAKDVGQGNRVAVAEDEPRLMERRALDETVAALADSRPDTAAGLAAAAAKTLADLESDHRDSAKLKQPVPRMLDAISDPALKERLFRAVYLDRLSGLRNRRWLFDNLDSLFKPGGARSYIALDIDKFGTLNEKVGEEKADLVLQELGRVLEDAVAGVDATALHLSGEEFVVLAGPGVADPRALGERVRERVQAQLGFRAAAREVVDPATGAPLTVTVSVGVAPVPQLTDGPGPMLTLATAMAESMLQRAKSRGRNQVVADDSKVSGAELMTRLSRLIRIDDRIREVVSSVISPAPPAEKASALDNSIKTRAQVIALLGANPFWKLALGGVARYERPGGRARLAETAPLAAVREELALRRILDAFELFNGTLAAPRAVAYQGWFGDPVLVTDEVVDRNPEMDGGHLPAAHKAALAAFVHTFGVTLGADSVAEVGWGRTTLKSLALPRAASSDGAPATPWVSERYLNDAADYRAAFTRWRETFARPGTRRELSSILRSAGTPEADIAPTLDAFARNLERLDASLAADIERANRAFRADASRAGLSERETAALSDINHAAHLSALGGSMRDVMRWLNGDERRTPPFHAEPAELKALASRRDAFTSAARLRLAQEADRGRVHRRDGERLSERQALDAFDALARRLPVASSAP
jgi:diguanylate cyclase (GGDEF)-like protein